MLGCKSRNVKVAAISATCLQRLVASAALPRDRLQDVLEAFRDCSSLGMVQNLLPNTSNGARLGCATQNTANVTLSTTSIW